MKSATESTVEKAVNVADDIEVLFLLSVPNDLKAMLLQSARLLVYTPSNEHFGIVPLEAMLAGTPVLAANTGGPLETVVQGVTGWLCSPEDVQQWTAVMDKVLNKLSEGDLVEMARAGKERVKNEFSDAAMAKKLDDIIDGMGTTRRRSVAGLRAAVSIFGMTALAVVSILLMYVFGR